MMELKSQSNVGIITASSRPLANFHPSVWGDCFLHLHMPQSSEAGAEQLVEELKVEVKTELKEASCEYLRLLKMVDAIQRLGIEYHFKEEIDEALQIVSEKFDDYCKDNHDMYTTALSFRLLRQHGYPTVSCKIFDKFTDEKLGGFKVANIEEVTGVLEFFEATHLRIHGEDILDEGYVLSRNYLESVLPDLKNPVAEQVSHALYEYSNRRGITRLEARHYISMYDLLPSHHIGLLRLAKLDFNLVQSLHKMELTELSRWWNGLEVPIKVSYARDRMVETYFWSVGVYFEPEYAVARKFLTKLQSLLSIIDDTFDAYATFEELQLFTAVIERWSPSCLDQLPNCMQVIYKALLDVFEEVEAEMIKQGTSYRTNYGIEAVKFLVRAYFAEIIWREEKHKPTTQEYLQTATKSCGYTSCIIISFLGMGDNIATADAFDWVLTQPDIVKAASIIARLGDDIVGHKFEHEREHIPSVVECYMEEHNVSIENAVKELNNRLESAWKDINKAFLKPTKIPVPLLYRILNLSRGIEVFYKRGDWYTHVGPEMQSFIKQLFIEPLP